MKRYYYFYDKDYKDLIIVYKYKYYYVYQKYKDWLKNDVWRYQLYGCYKITSIKAFRKEMLINIPAYEKRYGIDVRYKEIKDLSSLTKAIKEVMNDEE